MKRLLVTGGGTGGHVLAGVAVADEWKKRFGTESQILYVGAEQGHEARLVPKAGHRLELLRIGALNRVPLTVRLKTLFQLPLSLFKALLLILLFRPHAVLGVGGYASGPVMLIARIVSFFSGSKTAIIEQNSVTGMTNHWLGRLVHRVYTAFPDVSQSFDPKKVLQTGNPIRSHLKQLPAITSSHPFTLFVFGGSQGAVGMNTMVIDALPFLKEQGVTFIHQTGVKDFERVQSAYQRSGISNFRVERFIDDMESCYAQASLIVCRAGASSMTEISAVGRAAIFVPLPTAAGNHQEYNARIFEQGQAALVVPQGSMQGEVFSKFILDLKNDPHRLQAIASNVRGFYQGDAAAKIVNDLAQLGTD